MWLKKVNKVTTLEIFPIFVNEELKLKLSLLDYVCFFDIQPIRNSYMPA